jgi:hypothetical protein
VGSSRDPPIRGSGRSSELSLTAAAIPAILVALTPVRFRRWSMTAVLAVLALLAISNAVHYRIFSSFIRFAWLTCIPPYSFRQR